LQQHYLGYALAFMQNTLLTYASAKTANAAADNNCLWCSTMKTAAAAAAHCLVLLLLLTLLGHQQPGLERPAGCVAGLLAEGEPAGAAASSRQQGTARLSAQLRHKFSNLFQRPC
jgi:hypothetical protein